MSEAEARRWLDGHDDALWKRRDDSSEREVTIRLTDAERAELVELASKRLSTPAAEKLLAALTD
jgi:hypothetical protein